MSEETDDKKVSHLRLVESPEKKVTEMDGRELLLPLIDEIRTMTANGDVTAIAIAAIHPNGGVSHRIALGRRGNVWELIGACSAMAYVITHEHVEPD